MPARIIKKNHLSLTGYFPSLKNDRSMAYESAIERDFYLTLEFDPTVEDYQEQPFKIETLIDGKKRNYFPDCLINYRPEANRRPLLVEVKSERELQDKEKRKKLETKLAVFREFADENDMDFKLVTDRELREIYNLDGLKFIYNFRNEPPHLDKFKPVVLRVLKSNPLKISDLLKELSLSSEEQLQVVPVIWHLVCKQEIKTDFTRPINNNCLLEVNNGKIEL